MRFHKIHGFLSCLLTVLDSQGIVVKYAAIFFDTVKLLYQYRTVINLGCFSSKWWEVAEREKKHEKKKHAQLLTNRFWYHWLCRCKAFRKFILATERYNFEASVFIVVISGENCFDREQIASGTKWGAKNRICVTKLYGMFDFLIRNQI